jgi:hypothetical protein
MQNLSTSSTLVLGSRKTAGNQEIHPHTVNPRQYGLIGGGIRINEAKDGSKRKKNLENKQMERLII